MIDAFVVIFIGIILIIILNKLPERKAEANHPVKSVKRLFDSFEDQSKPEEIKPENEKKVSRRRERRTSRARQ